MSESIDKKIALLIDGDNAQAKFFESILSEAGKYGKVTVRRIYGDWTDSKLAGWKEILNKYSIRPMQKFAFASGKNSTDTAMIIDAMDILHAKTVSGFCIASSDSDYTGLVLRIKEEGYFVMGIGNGAITAKAFVNACDMFVFTENLNQNTGATKDNDTKNNAKQSDDGDKLVQSVLKRVDKSTLPISKITKEPLVIENIINAWKMVADDSGEAYIGEIGLAIRKIDPSFDSRTYDSPTLSKLIKRMSHYFEIVDRKNANGTTSGYIKLKQ